MNQQPTTNTATARVDTVSDRYQGTPPELYERYFVPSIGLPCAELLVDAAQLSPGERVLDVACGTGVATRLAADRVGPGGTVAGIDGHPGMLAVARVAAPATAAIDWREASADGLPYENDTFDVVLCSLGLQFFADKISSLAEMRRVVVDGGRVAVGVPGPTPPMYEELHDVLAEHFGVEVAAFVHAVFEVDDADRLADLLIASGLANLRVSSHRLALHLDPAADFFWQYVLATPLAAAVGGLGSDDRRALEEEIVERWRPYTVASDLVMEVDLHIATAQSLTLVAP
jgi:SAM-dependent methyltransferase